MPLYALRHEEREVMDATFDSMLTVTGRARAAGDLVRVLESLRPDAVYSSPYPRCVQTVLPFCWKSSTPLAVDASLAEYLHGSGEGVCRTLDWRALRLVGALPSHKHLESPDDIDAADHSLDRVAEFAEFVRECHGADKTILLCTHASCINRLRGAAIDCDFVPYGHLVGPL